VVHRSPVLRSIFVLKEPDFVSFCFHLRFLSIPEVQPFAGSHLFCVVSFSFVLSCPVPWCSVVMVYLFLCNFFCLFVLLMYPGMLSLVVWCSNRVALLVSSVMGSGLQFLLSSLYIPSTYWSSFRWGRLVRNMTYQFTSGEGKNQNSLVFRCWILVGQFLILALEQEKKENSSGYPTSFSVVFQWLGREEDIFCQQGIWKSSCFCAVSPNSHSQQVRQ